MFFFLCQATNDPHTLSEKILLQMNKYINSVERHPYYVRYKRKWLVFGTNLNATFAL